MERLTEENSVGVHVFKSNYSCERCGEEFCRLPDLGNGSPTDKLAEYEIMEQKLESVYGECDGLLEAVIEHLIKHPEIEFSKPTKARLLTDEDVDKWVKLKDEDVIPKRKVLELLYNIKDSEDIPKNYGTILDIIRQVRELPTF